VTPVRRRVGWGGVKRRTLTLCPSGRAREEQVEVRPEGRDDPHGGARLFVSAVYRVRRGSQIWATLRGWLIGRWVVVRREFEW
jgi:hypothetical protein